MSNNWLRLRNTRAPLKQRSKMKHFAMSFLYRFTRRDGEELAKSRQNGKGLGEPSVNFSTARPRTLYWN